MVMTTPAIPPEVEAGCEEVRQALNRLEHRAADVKSEALVKAQADSFAAWATRGAVLYELGKLSETQTAYRRALKLAEKFFGDHLPTRLRWTDSAERYALRTIHGNGLVAYRLGDAPQAQRFFAEEIRLNPADEQGAKYLLRDIKAGRTWNALGKADAA